ncbi:MAG: IMP dehydrogenase, partial [Ilumatobacteraceae bacterium]
LRCAAAVGVGKDLEERVASLVANGVDALSIDTAHGHSANVVKAIERIKGSWPMLPVTAGNVVTEEGVESLARAGADAVKVGVGAGSICTTRVVSGTGMPQLSAVWFATRRARELGVPVIADGGITFSGDIVKAIVAGAETVMLGSLLAGTEESPGEMELFEGRRYKAYRGMGSMGAMTGDSVDRYATGQSSGGRTAVGAGSNKLVPEGIEGRVPYAGPLGDVAYQLVGGLRSGMGYAGAATLEGLRHARLMRVTAAGRQESHPHDVTITKEAPNYQRS